MNLPKLSDPGRYRSLYVFDFGDWTAVGYTAPEVAILLEDPRYQAGKVYKIHNATPDGRLELRGVSTERFQLESAMLFWRDNLGDAREDFDALCAAVDRQPPPGRGFVHFAESLAAGQAGRFVTALVYPSEYDDEFARWLLDIDFQGGEQVEGGISMATTYYQLDRHVIDRRQLWSAATIAARTADEVFASVRQAVQR